METPCILKRSWPVITRSWARQTCGVSCRAPCILIRRYAGRWWSVCSLGVPWLEINQILEAWAKETRTYRWELDWSELKFKITTSFYLYLCQILKWHISVDCKGREIVLTLCRSWNYKAWTVVRFIAGGCKTEDGVRVLVIRCAVSGNARRIRARRELLARPLHITCLILFPILLKHLLSGL